MQVILSFLALAPPAPSLWRKMLSRRRANQQRTAVALLPATRTLLNAFYAPFNRELSLMMGSTRYMWDDIL